MKIKIKKKYYNGGNSLYIIAYNENNKSVCRVILTKTADRGWIYSEWRWLRYCDMAAVNEYIDCILDEIEVKENIYPVNGLIFEINNNQVYNN